jgi:S-adenosylmethionine:tRNA ribosyltransferase-isomerase
MTMPATDTERPVGRNPALAFTLPPSNEAQAPPESRGVERDGVRLLVSAGEARPTSTVFHEISRFLRAGDALVVNTSSTVAAALDGRLPGGDPVAVHLSGELPGGLELVEVRTPAQGATVPRRIERAIDVALLHGGTVHLLAPFGSSERLWVAALDLPTPLHAYLAAHGRPIRYRHVAHDWPLAAYQTVFGRVAGSAEMPSASRPFTDHLVTELSVHGVGVLPILLHTGVSSLEGDEAPYPERYAVSDTTAASINATRARGGRVIAVGTTVVRALATTTDARGEAHPGSGWTEAFVTADTPVPSVDGLLTGWHEPESTHLQMLRAFASRDALEAAYGAALDLGYLWHEFGDSHLILPAERA